jgi:hypothetical protein
VEPETELVIKSVINHGSGTGTRYKIMYLISFILQFFHSHFTINLLKLTNFFLVKKLIMLKAKKIQIFFYKFAFYGLDMEQEPEPARNFSKVGTKVTFRVCACCLDSYLVYG